MTHGTDCRCRDGWKRDNGNFMEPGFKDAPNAFFDRVFDGREAHGQAANVARLEKRPRLPWHARLRD